MKRKTVKFSKIVPVALILCIIAVGVTLSFMYEKTGKTINRFVKAEVSCAVDEVFYSDKGEKTSIKVNNTGNIPAYIRVKLVSNWIDEDDNIVGKSSVMPEIKIKDGWIPLGSNTYYYSQPVEPGGYTAEFLAEKVTLDEKDGLRQTLVVLAEAVQSEPYESVKDAWGITE